MPITYRAVKGAKLNTSEFDGNFSYLDGRIDATAQHVNGIAALRALNIINDKSVWRKYHAIPGDGGQLGFEGKTGAAPGTYADNNGTTVIPAGGDGSAAWVAVLGDDVSVDAFGCGVGGDIATGLQAAVTYAVANGKHFTFGARTYLCSAKITSSGADVSFSGAGSGVSRVAFTSTTGGFEFALDTQAVNTPPDQLRVRDITIESRATVSTPALSAAWSTYQPNAQGSCWIDNVNITRQDNGTGSFTAGIKLNKCIIGTINDCSILGDEARVSTYGIQLIDCLGIRIGKTDVNRYAEGLSATVVSAVQTEGLYLTDCFIYDVNKGITVNKGIHIEVLGTHVNINGAAAAYGINFTTVSQSFVSQALIYTGGSAGDAANQDGVQLSACSGITINNTVFTGVTKANTRYAIALSGLCTYNQVNHNNISSYTTGVTLAAAGDTNNNLIGNQFAACTAKISDVGTNNYKALNTSDGVLVDGLRWGGIGAGAFGVGEISVDINWGGFIRGRSGGTGDLALADSGGTVCASVRDGSLKVKEYLVGGLPPATRIGGTGLICVTNEVGGLVLAFSDGTNWRRVTDRAIVS